MALQKSNGNPEGPTNEQQQFYACIQQEYKILSEYKMIQSENVAGIYVIPSYKSSFLWFGVIFVRSGYYTDGIFRFNISLPDKFPDDSEVPAVIFETNVIHPLINPYTNRLEMGDAFSTWNSAENRIWQLLKYIQFVFEHVDVCMGDSNSGKVAANRDAADMWRTKRADYLACVKECIRVGRDEIYAKPKNDDKHYITFERFDKDVHGQTLESIKNGTADSSISSPSASGVSWML